MLKRFYSFWQKLNLSQKRVIFFGMCSLIIVSFFPPAHIKRYLDGCGCGVYSWESYSGRVFIFSTELDYNERSFGLSKVGKTEAKILWLFYLAELLCMLSASLCCFFYFATKETLSRRQLRDRETYQILFLFFAIIFGSIWLVAKPGMESFNHRDEKYEE